MNSNAEKDASKLIDLLPVLYQELNRRENNFLTQGKISCPQMIALQTIHDAGRIRMSGLAKALDIKTATATGLSDRLIKSGWVTRSNDDNDRRVVWLMLSASGRKVIRDIYLQKKKIMTAVFRKIPEKETGDYVRLFEKIVHILSEDKS